MTEYSNHDVPRILKNVIAIRDTLWSIEDVLHDWSTKFIDGLGFVD